MVLDYFNSIFTVTRVDLNVSPCCFFLFFPAKPDQGHLALFGAASLLPLGQWLLQAESKIWMWSVSQPLKACELVFPAPVCQAAYFYREIAYPCERADLPLICSANARPSNPPSWPPERRCPMCSRQDALRVLSHIQASLKSEEVLKGKVILYFKTSKFCTKEHL